MIKNILLFVSLFLLAIVVPMPIAADMAFDAPDHLTCEYLTNPLGIDVLSPRLAWQVNDTRKGAVQSAYQILVSVNPENLVKNQGEVWDSGKVQSNVCIQVPYTGSPLKSGVRCYWVVRTWDGKDQASPYSQPAYWQMGLLEQSDWKAQWIELDPWIKDRQPDGSIKQNDPGKGWNPNPSPVLRKTFSLPAPVAHASLTATALGLYEMSINGKRTGKNLLAPEWTDYRTRIQYQTYNVTADLHEGNNAIGAVLGDGWYAGRVGLMANVHIYGDHLALYAQMDIECTDGSRHTIITDPSWKGTLDGPIRGTDIIHGEIHDARKEMPGWNTPGFDDSQWAAVSVYDAPKVQMVAQKNEAIQITEELTPIKVTEPKPNVYVYDLGQNMVGWCRVKINGEAGTSVKLRYAEVLNPDGTIYTENLRGPFQIDEIILNGSEILFEPRFTYHGFRYLEITGLKEALPLKNITGCVVHSAPPMVSSFECSNPMINQLVKNILWTQRGNMHSTPTDCPQRDERLGWMGDAQIFSQAACFNMNMAAFYTKWIQDIRDAQTAQGQYSDISPNPIKEAGQFLASPSWADAGIIVPWQVYVNYGDTRLLEQHYLSMQRWVNYVQENSDKYIWTKGRGNDYGDWLNGDTLILKDWPNKGADISREQLATAYSAHSVDLLAQIAQVLGKKEDAQKYAQLFENIRNAYVEKYFEKNGKNKEDNQTAYTLGLHFNLIPQSMREAAVNNILRKIKDYNGHISTGIQATNRMMMELANEGHADAAYQLLNNRTIPSWGYMVDHGATTVWERWDGWVDGRGFQNAGMNSFNHYAIGAVGEWIFRNIAGINPDPDQPGYKHFIIEPRPGGGLTSAKASYNSIHGLISTEWKKDQNSFTLNVTIPANTTASVVLPVKQVERITESGSSLKDLKSIKITQVNDKEISIEIPAGHYQFQVGPGDNAVRVGANHFLEADGKPFFTIGAYAFPKDMTYEEGKAMGFNLVGISSATSDWNAASQAGLKVWHSFGSDFDFDAGSIEEKKTNIQKIVHQFSTHPALLFWESMDEPAWTDGNPALARASAQSLAKGYQYLNSLDTNHPVYLNHAPRNTADTLRAYNSGCDIVCVDVYPIIPPGMKPMYAITPEGRHGDLPNQTPSCVGEFVDKMKHVANADQSVFVVLQGFAWEALNGDKSDPKFVRYPSYQESRFMAYNAITHGVNGLMYWGLSYTPKDHAFIKDLSRILHEINDLTPAILGRDLSSKPTLRYAERGSTITSGVEILAKETDTGIYLITSNTSIDPAGVTFMALPPELSSVKSLTVAGENRTVKIEDGAFVDEFDGLGVHVYYYAKSRK